MSVEFRREASRSLAVMGQLYRPETLRRVHPGSRSRGWTPAPAPVD